jgi:hypothetical protein
MLSQDGLAIGLNFAEGDGLESPGAFKPEAKSADAAEQVEDSEHVIAALDASCRRPQPSLRVALAEGVHPVRQHLDSLGFP